MSCCTADNSLVGRTNIIRAVHVRGMLVSFICVISANTCGNACPSNANAREWREREGKREGTADVYWPVHAREGARACHNYTHMVAGGMHTW